MDSAKNKMRIQTKRGVIKSLIVVLIILLPIIVILALQEPRGKEVPKKESAQINIPLQAGHGIVTNIWFSNFSKLREFEEAGIKYLIVDVGDTDSSGMLETDREEITEFLEFIEEYENENDYNFILLPYSEVNTYDYNFDNPELRSNLISDYIRLVLMGFDGIHVDIEPIQFHQRSAYLKFLEELRNSLDSRTILSVYSGHLGKSYFNEWEWDAKFYQEVGDYARLICIPGYDIDLNTKEEYQKDIINKIRELNAMEIKSQIILGIPTHKQEPETIQNALEAYSSEIQKYSQQKFMGVVIFAEWTTDSNEWNTFKQFSMS